MREGKRRLILLLPRKFCQSRNHVDELLPDKDHGLTHDNNIGIVTDIAARRAEVNDPLCLRALLSVRIDMAHDIVADNLLAFTGDIVIDILRVLLHFVDHLIGDPIDSEFLLRLGKSDPKFPPGAELVVFRKDELHFFACVPLRKRADIAIGVHCLLRANSSINECRIVLCGRAARLFYHIRSSYPQILSAHTLS